MDDYLKKVKESSGIENLNICPFLFYNLIPYIVTFAKGGWFVWVKRKNLSYRKTINNVDFHKKSINSLYPNEVLVCCSNPEFNVVAAIGPWLEDKIKIRILSASELCLNHHKPQEEFIIDSKQAQLVALKFNREFPKKLIETFSDKLGQAKIEPCCNQYKLGVNIAKIIHPCRYHKDTRKLNSPLLPEGLCIHIFQAVYPYVLARMYNAEVETELKINCPIGNCRVTASLAKTAPVKNIFLRIFIHSAKKLIKTFFKTVDFIDYNLTVTIADIENKPRVCFLEKSKVYPVNVRSRDFICPASFHVLYPYLLIRASGHKMAWDENEKDNRAGCPDCAGIIYNILEIFPLT